MDFGSTQCCKVKFWGKVEQSSVFRLINPKAWLLVWKSFQHLESRVFHIYVHQWSIRSKLTLGPIIKVSTFRLVSKCIRPWNGSGVDEFAFC